MVMLTPLFFNIRTSLGHVADGGDLIRRDVFGGTLQSRENIPTTSLIRLRMGDIEIVWL